MEFSKKLQELRQQKGLTQEELAQVLLVSRTAVSKWESGRGYPNIDSLKAISSFFGITVDELLSGDELLTLAEHDTKQKETHFRDLCFGLLDIAVALFWFLPFFGQKISGTIQEVSLLKLTEIAQYLRLGYYAIVVAIIVFGVLTLAMQNCSKPFWMQAKSKISLLLSIVAVVLFTISTQPYAAIFCFAFLIIKVLMLIKFK